MVKIIHKKQRYRYVFIALALIAGLGRFGHYLVSEVPLGYDPGIYIYLTDLFATALQQFSFPELPERINTEPLFFVFSGIFQNLGGNTHWLVTRGTMFLTLLPAGILTYYGYRRQKSVYYLAAVLSLLSIGLYQLGFLGYIKQLLGISAMIAVFLFFQEKKYIGGVLVLVLLGLLHRTTFLYTGLTLGVFRLYTRRKQKHIDKKMLRSLIGGAGLLLIRYFLRGKDLWDTGREVVFQSLGGKGLRGIFFPRQKYLLYTLVLCTLALTGIVSQYRKKELSIRTVGLIIGCIWLGTGFANYERMLALRDLCIVVQAAYGVSFLLQKKKRRVLSAVLVTLLQTVTFLSYLRQARPYISEHERKGIQYLSTLLPEDAVVMVTHKNYTPWVMGYSQRRRISPGLSEKELWDEIQWKEWWYANPQEKCHKLHGADVDKNRIYIRQGERQLEEGLLESPCLDLWYISGSFQIYKTK